MAFVNLSVHTHFSVTGPSSIGDFAGSARPKELLDRAVILEQPALAITDLGTLRGIQKFTNAANKVGVKPIYGAEVYMCPNHLIGRVPKEKADEICAGQPPSEWRKIVDEYAELHGYTQSDRDLTTLTLWAIDDEGLKNLYKITSAGWVDGFYYKPRVSPDLLNEHSAGVACGTAGPNSWIHRPMLEGKRRVAINRASELSSIFEGRFYLEIRPHRVMVQDKANKFALELSQIVGGTLLATQGVHYINKGDLDVQKMLCSIGAVRTELDMCGCSIDSYWLRSRAEMLEAFAECEIAENVAVEACDETLKFADKCTAKFVEDPFAMIIPDIDVGRDHVEYLRDLCSKSSRRSTLAQAMNRPGDYENRLNEELEALGKPVSPGSEMTFASYIVYVHEVVKMCNDMNIPLGPGRGSAAGSLVNWLIGITDVDPVEHDLLFSRFIAPGRVGPPDIDIDFDPERRNDLLEAMRERWGVDCVAQISTFSKLKGKVVVNDVCRTLKIPRNETNRVTKLIEARSDYAPRPFSTVSDAFIGHGEEIAKPDCARFHAQYPEVLRMCAPLEGKIRNLGIHPAGIVVSPKPLVEYCPLETRRDADGNMVVVTAFDMKGVEAIGLQKVDMLGLITITTIHKIADSVRENVYETFELSDIPLDDKKTLEAFSARDFAGVFQYDSASAKRLCKGVDFDSFGVISDMTALNRPGPLDSGMAEEYVKRKGDPSLVEVDYCDKVSAITKGTFGIMVYQEQIMQISSEVGLHENPDVMRKIIGKKIVDKIQAERAPFISGAATSSPDMSNEVANKLFDDIATFGQYGFNKSHSVAYAKLAYICQYLKVHYPLDFWWSTILMAKDDKRNSLAKEAKASGIRLMSPNVSKSGFALTIDRDRNAIVGALTDIKGVGLKAAKSIVKNQPFSSFEDFMTRVDTRVVNSGTIKALTYAGAFDDLLDNPAWFIENADEILHERKLKRFKGWEASLAPGSADGVPRWTNTERLEHASNVNPMALENPYTDVLENLPIEIVDFSSDSFFSDQKEACWVFGTLSDCKIYQETGWGDSAPSEEERSHRSYGKDYLVGSLQSESTAKVKIKIPWWVYDLNEVEEGDKLLCLVVPDDQYSTLRVRSVVQLNSLSESSSDPIIQTVLGHHPILSISMSEYDTSLRVKPYSKLIGGLHKGTFKLLPVFGVVTDIKTKIAGKNKTEMAWIGVLTPDGTYVNVTVFSGDWLGGWDFRSKKELVGLSDRVSVGDCIQIEVRSNQWGDKFSCQFSGSNCEFKKY